MTPPPITALEGPGSGSLGRKQRYTVTELRDCKKGDKGCKKKTTLFSGQLLSAVPSNIGPFTMPDYEALAAQGVYTDASAGARVFAGQRAETFAIDLGAVFDTINLRRNLPILTLAEDANDNVNSFGFNAFSGFNVNTIALELPISRLTSDRQAVGDANKLIGVYAATSRTKKQIHVGEPKEVDFKDDTLINTGDVPRRWRGSGNPLVNELIIPLGKKDMWNASAPEDEAQFVADYRRLDVAKALQFVSNVPVPTGPRDDIVALLLTYPGQSSKAKLSDLLRLDMSVPPTPPAQIKRLGPLAHDAAGNPTPDPAVLPERAAAERRRDRHRRARRRRRELHREPRGRRREPEREGHHPRLPVPAHAVRRPRPAPHGSGRVATVTARRPIRRAATAPGSDRAARRGDLVLRPAPRRTSPATTRSCWSGCPTRAARRRASCASCGPARRRRRGSSSPRSHWPAARSSSASRAATRVWWARPRPRSRRGSPRRSRRPGVLVLHATVQQNRHRFTAALATLERVLARDPRNAQAWLTRAMIELVRGEPRAALASCTRLLGTRRGALHRGLRGSRALARGRAARQLRRARHRAR